MKPHFNSFLVKTVVVFTALFFCNCVNAQDWSDMTDWLCNSGKSKLALLAHPIDAQGDVSYKIDDVNSRRIVISIRYVDDVTGPYTDTYTIERGTYDGVDYFRRIRVDESSIIFQAFKGIDDYGSGYADIYSQYNYYLLFGEDSYWDLSRSEKAAFVLFGCFLEWYRG